MLKREGVELVDYTALFAMANLAAVSEEVTISWHVRLVMRNSHDAPLQLMTGAGEAYKANSGTHVHQGRRGTSTDEMGPTWLY